MGRDSEIGALSEAWLATPPQPVAVLGAPGIGKSAVCLAALLAVLAAEPYFVGWALVRLARLEQMLSSEAGTGRQHVKAGTASAERT